MAALLHKAWDGVAARCDTTLPSLVTAGGANSLPARWVSLCESLGVAPHQQAVWWRTIRDCLCHRTRHYRTLDRLEALFREFDKCSAALEAPSHVALALFFRDVALDPTVTAAPPHAEDAAAATANQDDKNDSAAALCRRFCAEAVSPEHQLAAAASAAALVEHSFDDRRRTPSSSSLTTDVDAQGDLSYFIDVLSVPLAASPDEFATQCFAERLERHSVGEDEWVQWRGDYLETTYLKQPRVFRACPSPPPDDRGVWL
jgi:predicted metal-dependent HD superfamily phosphohydrolase